MVPPDDAISNEKTLGVDYNFALDDRYTKSDGVRDYAPGGMSVAIGAVLLAPSIAPSGRRVKRLPVEVSISTPASMKISR
jgi:hypothetical protein